MGSAPHNCNWPVEYATKKNNINGVFREEEKFVTNKKR